MEGAVTILRIPCERGEASRVHLPQHDSGGEESPIRKHARLRDPAESGE
jgi:hypothetical protein